MQLSQSDSNICSLLTGYQTISLDATNRMAKMLKRTEHKYVINLEQFQSLLSDIRDQYSVLEIDGRKQFAYASCYYDDDFGCYFEHHQARRQRLKVRTREYVDSGLKFFEIKLKGLRGLTSKHRVNCDSMMMPIIDGEHLQMLNDLYTKQYKKPMPFHLRPALMVCYKRCTLVAKGGGERVTIDHALQFSSPSSSHHPVRIGNDFMIVETKSKDGKGVADRTLKRLGIRKATKCSKYCIGLNLIGEVTKNNNFLHTIKRVRQNIVSNSNVAAVVGQ